MRRLRVGGLGTAGGDEDGPAGFDVVGVGDPLAVGLPKVAAGFPKFGPAFGVAELVPGDVPQAVALADRVVGEPCFLVVVSR